MECPQHITGRSDLHVRRRRRELVLASADVGAEVVVGTAAGEEVKVRRVVGAVGAVVLVDEPLLQVWHVELVAHGHGPVAGARRRDGAVLVADAAREAGASVALVRQLQRAVLPAIVAVGGAVAIIGVSVVHVAVECDADVGGCVGLGGYC